MKVQLRRQGALLLLVPALVLAGCGGEEPVARAVECGQDPSSLVMKDTIERVGGLRTDHWVVKLARSTELGVVAFVAGKIEEAASVLLEDYGVALVEPWLHGMDTSTAFARVRQVVDERCG